MVIKGLIGFKKRVEDYSRLSKKHKNEPIRNEKLNNLNLIIYQREQYDRGDRRMNFHRGVEHNQAEDERKKE